MSMEEGADLSPPLQKDSTLSLFTTEFRNEINRSLELNDLGEASTEEVLEEYETFVERFLVAPRDLFRMREWIYDRFDDERVRAEGSRCEDILTKAYQISTNQILQLQYQLLSRGLDTDTRQNNLRRCMAVLHRAHAHIIQEYRLRETIESEDSVPHLDMVVDNFSTRTETLSGLTDLQKLYQFLLLRCRDQNLRKMNDSLYREIVTDDGHYTRAWEVHMTIVEFIHESCDRESHYVQWKWMTGSPGNVVSATNYLQNCRDKFLPELRRNRYFISFRNGIYAIPTDEFYPYSGSKLDPTITSVNFLNYDFPEELCDKDDDGLLVTELEDIVIPSLEKLIGCQRLEPEVVRWLWVFMGRLLYHSADLDNWQRVPFIKGVAGAGKSCLGHMFEMIYGELLGAISSNIEPQFGLEGLLDKLMWICYEVKEQFRLDQGQLQSMTSRDPVVVARKHKIAIVVRKWIAGGLLLGNEWPKSWADAAGALSRRLMIWFFDYKPSKIDPHLVDDMKADIAKIIVMWNRSYLSAIQEMNGESLEKHMPEYFLGTQKKLEVQTNPLMAFLIYCDELEVHPEKYISVGDFNHIYTRYCRENGFPIVRLTDTHKVGRVFSQMQIEEKTEPRPYGPRGEIQELKFYLGIGKREDDFVMPSNSANISPESHGLRVMTETPTKDKPDALAVDVAATPSTRTRRAFGGF